MPGYPFLASAPLKGEHLAEQMKILRVVGVPYTDEQIESAQADLLAQNGADSPEAAAMRKRYPNAVLNDSPANAGVTEEDALVAYLQHLGVSVDFRIYDDKANIR
jgi:cytochrome c oxidase cbb3-type subunit 2